MIIAYLAMAFALISGFALTFTTSDVIDGVCDLEMSCISAGIRDLVFLIFLRHATYNLYILLLAYSDCHSSSDKCNDRPQYRWTKHRSNPVKSDSDQRGQNNDLCQRILRRDRSANECVLFHTECPCKSHNILQSGYYASLFISFFSISAPTRYTPPCLIQSSASCHV